MFKVKSSNYGIDIGNLPVAVRYRFEEATAAINDLETYANTLDGTQRDNLLTTCDYLRIVKRYVNTSYGLDVVKQYSPQLEAWATDDNSPVQIPAQLLLEQAYPEQFDYPEKIELPEKNRNKAMPLPLWKETQNNFPEQDNLIMVYPNPAKDILQIEYLILNQTSNCMIGLYDLKGTLLKSEPVKEKIGTVQFNVSDIPEGTYLISVCEYGNKSYTKRINVIH